MQALFVSIVMLSSSGVVLAQSSPPTAVALRADDEQLVARGEIEDEAWIGGTATSLLGFGIGQAVEGRWNDTGWIFTLGESLSAATMVGGAIAAFENCPFFGGYESSSCKFSYWSSIGGLVAMAGFHVAGIVDAVVGPTVHNRHVREARNRLGIMPYVAPIPHGEQLGFALSF